MQILGLSWPVIGWSALVLLVGFTPLVLIGALEPGGVMRRLLAGLGPALVCLCFALLVLVYGMRYAASGGMSRRQVWALAGLFVALAALSGWGLFVSV
jgi:hypothetical protein